MDKTWRVTCDCGDFAMFATRHEAESAAAQHRGPRHMKVFVDRVGGTA